MSQFMDLQSRGISQSWAELAYAKNLKLIQQLVQSLVKISTSPTNIFKIYNLCLHLNFLLHFCIPSSIQETRCLIFLCLQRLIDFFSKYANHFFSTILYWKLMYLNSNITPVSYIQFFTTILIINQIINFLMQRFILDEEQKPNPKKQFS